MCEMLGLSARRPLAANDLLRRFYARAAAHPHGWGLARFTPGGHPLVEKEPVRADESAYLAARLRAPLDERLLLAHIRLATIGALEYENCHPFTCTDAQGRAWTLVHNGTVFHPEALDAATPAATPRGATDSERILLYLVAHLDARRRADGADPSRDVRFDVLSDAIARLAPGNKLNLLLTDGETLYAHTNFRDSLHLRLRPGEAVFATHPLGADDWTRAPFARLVAVRDGEIVRTGAPHGHEYVYNPEDYRLLYMDYAAL